MKRKAKKVRNTFIILGVILAIGLVFFFTTRQGILDNIIQLEETDTIKYQSATPNPYSISVSNPQGSGNINIYQYAEQVYGKDIKIENEKIINFDGDTYKFVVDDFTILSKCDTPLPEISVYLNGQLIDSINAYDIMMEVYSEQIAKNGVKCRYGTYSWVDAEKHGNQVQNIRYYSSDGNVYIAEEPENFEGIKADFNYMQRVIYETPIIVNKFELISAPEETSQDEDEETEIVPLEDVEEVEEELENLDDGLTEEEKIEELSDKTGFSEEKVKFILEQIETPNPILRFFKNLIQNLNNWWDNLRN